MSQGEVVFNAEAGKALIRHGPMGKMLLQLGATELELFDAVEASRFRAEERIYGEWSLPSSLREEALPAALRLADHTARRLASCVTVLKLT